MRNPAKGVRQRQSIEVGKHEWEQIREDAKAHGLSAGKFLLLLWRNWRISRASLTVVPELPVEPWRKAG